MTAKTISIHKFGVNWTDWKIPTVIAYVDTSINNVTWMQSVVTLQNLH